MMNYKNALDKGLPIGSGETESSLKACDTKEAEDSGSLVEDRKC
ncbi:hypothetical protein [Neochlamydia sp. EPS4]|nr:hypothetical protein [Neochlamydia sp. EPS4]